MDTPTNTNRPIIHSLLLLIGVPALAGPAIAQDEGDPAFSVASVLVDGDAFDRPHDVELLGDLAFVPGKGGSLAIVDVAHPEAPKVLWHHHDGKELDDAETVLVGKERLYLGTHDFHSIDLANPRAPVFQGKVSDRKRITRINGMVRRGDTIFAASKHGWLDAFDVRSPAQPELAGAVNLREQNGIGFPHDIDLYREYVVVPDPSGFDPKKHPGKLALIRVFDTVSGDPLPEARWEVAGVVASTELAGANRVQVCGQYAFVGASTRAQGGRLVVVDLSDPGSPRQLAVLPFAPSDGYGPNGLTVAGSVVFLAGGYSVEAIDVRNPKRPVKLASQGFPNVLKNANPRYPGGGDSGHDLVYRDGYLYVTGQNDRCLLILCVESERIRGLAGYPRKF